MRPGGPSTALEAQKHRLLGLMESHNAIAYSFAPTAREASLGVLFGSDSEQRA
jgi:hypothetical protein